MGGREFQSLGAEQLKAPAPIVVSLKVGTDRRAAEEEHGKGGRGGQGLIGIAGPGYGEL